MGMIVAHLIVGRIYMDFGPWGVNYTFILPTYSFPVKY